MSTISEKIKAYIDLTRIHFCPVWILLILTGLFLAFAKEQVFFLELTIKVAFIGFFGFEAGLVLNDYIDRDLDKNDVEHDKMDYYWRLFKSKPLPSGRIPSSHALGLFLILVILTTTLILTLPSPNRYYLLLIMGYSYLMETFYQLKKRKERFPFAQLLGRTDFTLFPIAGYLAYSSFDMTALLYMLFFYPWTMIHLAINDMADLKNDVAKKMNTITTLFKLKGTVNWILLFTTIHIITAILFLGILNTIARIGFVFSFVILIIINIKLTKKKTSDTAFKTLPILHSTLLIYMVSLLLEAYLLLR